MVIYNWKPSLHPHPPTQTNKQMIKKTHAGAGDGDLQLEALVHAQGLGHGRLLRWARHVVSSWAGSGRGPVPGDLWHAFMRGSTDCEFKRQGACSVVWMGMGVSTAAAAVAVRLGS